MGGQLSGVEPNQLPVVVYMVVFPEAQLCEVSLDVESTKNCDGSGFGKSPTKVESSKGKWEGCRGEE